MLPGVIGSSIAELGVFSKGQGCAVTLTGNRSVQLLVGITRLGGFCGTFVTVKQLFLLFTFCVSRRRCKMYCGHARLCVCLSVCPRPHAHTTAQTWM